MPSEENQIQATLESFEERYAVLRTADNTTFNWPIKNLPDHAKVGDSLTVEINTEKDQTNLDYANKRKLLEELIN